MQASDRRAPSDCLSRSIWWRIRPARASFDPNATHVDSTTMTDGDIRSRTTPGGHRLTFALIPCRAMGGAVHTRKPCLSAPAP